MQAQEQSFGKVQSRVKPGFGRMRGREGERHGAAGLASRVRQVQDRKFRVSSAPRGPQNKQIWV